MLCYKILISGSLFKTGFRYYLKAKASLLGITGCVYYENENSVGVIASGNPEELEKFMEFCMIGNQFYKITGIEIIEIPHHEYSSFEVEDKIPEIPNIPDNK
jgi:acylphosphatase